MTSRTTEFKRFRPGRFDLGGIVLPWTTIRGQPRFWCSCSRRCEQDWCTSLCIYILFFLTRSFCVGDRWLSVQREAEILFEFAQKARFIFRHLHISAQLRLTEASVHDAKFGVSTIEIFD